VRCDSLTGEAAAPHPPILVFPRRELDGRPPAGVGTVGLDSSFGGPRGACAGTVH